MTIDEQGLLHELCEILELEAIQKGSSLSSGMADWDSLAIISTIAYLNIEMGRTVAADELARCKTVQDIIDLL